MFKIVILKGGVGNQLFQYHLYSKLKDKGHWVYFKDQTMSGMSHYGRELDRYFDIDIKPIPFLLYIYLKFFWHFFPKKYKAATANESNFNEGKLFFNDYWQDRKYMSDSAKIKLKALPLSEKNKAILYEIENTQSVCIHVRRGDYLHPRCIPIFGGICTKEYYNEAIKTIRTQILAARFFVFSDDIDWCKANLKIENATYIDWNTDHDSIYDMLLMSRCKANIIANSTFSYWGAKLSGNKVVVYPKKWFANMPAPDIFPEAWTGI